MKVAYFCEPQYGGTFSFFKKMRPALASHQIDLRCIPPLSAERFPGTPFAALDGVDYVSFPENDPVAATEVLREHLTENAYDAVVVLPGTDVVCTNIVRYVPSSIRTIARVPMITRGAYAPTQVLASHLNRICGVSHRVRTDLVTHYGMSEDLIEVIYNGVPMREECLVRSVRSAHDPIVIVYSGRLYDLDKGVMLLPGILKRVRQRGIDARLELVGSGPDEERLQRIFAREGLLPFVTFRGRMEVEQVHQALREATVYILPSRFEGCPNALLEAMSEGCACVAARIKGSVDYIVEHGVSGLLASVADEQAFADHIVQLALDPEMCEAMGEAARRRISECFTIQHTASAYAALLQDVCAGPDRREEPLPLASYTIPKAMKPTWRTWIPGPVKNVIRKWMER